MKSQFLGLDRRLKIALQMSFDVLVIVFSYILAVVIDSGTITTAPQAFDFLSLLVCIPVSLLCTSLSGAYRSVLRYTSANTLARLTVSYTLSAAALWLIEAIRTTPASWATAMIFGLLSAGFGIGARFALRSYFRGSWPAHRSNVIIYGAGDLGRQLLTSLQQGNGLLAVGLIDDSDTLSGSVIGGVKVHPPSHLKTLMARVRVDYVLVATRSLSRDSYEDIVSLAKDRGIPVRKVPDLDEIIAGRAEITKFRNIEIADLLGRDPVSPIQELMDAKIRLKAVMVTGAGGSIGKELCKQIVHLNPTTIVLVENNELALYQIEQLLSELKITHKLQTLIVPVLASVTDKDAITRRMIENSVDTVYHAAAYKHVPLLEDNVISALENNVVGTRMVLEAAIYSGVTSFTLISTDKAVRPTNVMGASKRFAELVCQAYSQEQSGTKISMVRFGNVLASSGSVIPHFQRQIERGGPVTVTHPDVTRYFMTIPEAAQLVIQASGMAATGEVFVLDMGSPIRILDLAQAMIRLSGFEPHVVSDKNQVHGLRSNEIGVVFTSLRPGEKLYEELLVDAIAMETAHPRIMKAAEDVVPFSILRTYLDSLDSILLADDQCAAFEMLCALPLHYSFGERLQRRGS